MRATSLKLDKKCT